MRGEARRRRGMKSDEFGREGRGGEGEWEGEVKSLEGKERKGRRRGRGSGEFGREGRGGKGMRMSLGEGKKGKEGKGR